MLKIENYERLKGKVIGNTGYYVDSIKSAELISAKHPTSHYYHIEITNRKQVLMVQLDRTGFSIGNGTKLYEMKLGQNYINLNKFKLRNMDVVIDNINKLLLGDWLP